MDNVRVYGTNLG